MINDSLLSFNDSMLLRSASGIAKRLTLRQLRVLSLVLGALTMSAAMLLSLSVLPSATAPTLTEMALVLAGACLLGGVVFGLCWMGTEAAWRLSRVRKELTSAATQDTVTGAFNLRHYLTVAEAEWARCQRYNIEAAMILVQSDQAYTLSLSHGELFRDTLMRRITETSQPLLRKADFVGRFSEDQIAIFVPHTDPLGAVDVAERIREHIEAMVLPWHGQNLRSTVSIGVTSMSQQHHHLDDMMRDTVRMMLQAQGEGGNCVRASALQPKTAHKKQMPEPLLNTQHPLSGTTSSGQPGQQDDANGGSKPQAKS